MKNMQNKSSIPSPRKESQNGNGRFSDAERHESVAEWVVAAHEIGETVLRASLDTRREFLWLRHESVPGSSRRALVPVDFGLEYGQTGIALFFAMLASITRSATWAKACRGALHPVMEALEYKGPGPRYVDRFGAASLESTLSGFRRIANILGDDALLQRSRCYAVRHCVEYDDAHIQKNSLPDVMTPAPHVSIPRNTNGRRTNQQEEGHAMNAGSNLGSVPDTSIIDGGLAGTLALMIQAAMAGGEDARSRQIPTFASVLATRFRTGSLGGHLSIPALIPYSPSLMDGLSGIGLVLLHAACFTYVRGRGGRS